MADVAVTLLVLRTRQLDACRSFYEAIGLALVAEQLGSGPLNDQRQSRA